MNWVFAGMLFILSIACFKTAWDEFGDRQKWLTPSYLTLGMAAIFGAIFMLATPTLAQQPPDPASLQKAIVVLQQQRNAAMDQAAGVQVEAQRLAEENAALKKQVEELQKKAETTGAK